MGFMGYLRADGRVGVRNHVIVMSAVSCCNAVVEQIGRAVPGIKTITHTEGCGRGPRDVAITLRTLANTAAHPNVAGVILIGLGGNLDHPRFGPPLASLPAALGAKLHVVRQSALPLPGLRRPAKRNFDICVIGHLRDEKDPFRTALAARRLPRWRHLRSPAPRSPRISWTRSYVVAGSSP